MIKGEGFMLGLYGLYVYEIGECKVFCFELFGNYFNFDDKKYGFFNLKGVENGDLLNVVVDGFGKIKVEIDVFYIIFEEGKMTIYRKDGVFIIIIENFDDGMI